jgi:hypothetical protein
MIINPSKGWNSSNIWEQKKKKNKSIQEEIKSRMNLVNAYYHLVQNLLSCSLLSKNIKITIHKAIILPVVLYGCETWSLKLREELG